MKREEKRARQNFLANIFFFKAVCIARNCVKRKIFIRKSEIIVQLKVIFLVQVKLWFKVVLYSKVQVNGIKYAGANFCPCKYLNLQNVTLKPRNYS